MPSDPSRSNGPEIFGDRDFPKAPGNGSRKRCSSPTIVSFNGMRRKEPSECRRHGPCIRPIPIHANAISSRSCAPPLTDQIMTFLDQLDEQLAAIDPDARATAPVRQPAPRTDKDFFALLNRIDRAIRNRQIITIGYRKTAGGRLEQRAIAPYELHNHSGRFYVWGTDEGGTKPKFFALDRIEGIDSEEGDSFERDPNLGIDKELRHSFGVWVGSGKPQDIQVEISESRATDVFARRWPAEKSIQFLPSGRLRITFCVTDAREVVAWVLGFGGEAWIREPASAARLAWELSQKVVALHEWARDVPIDERVMQFEWGADGLPLHRAKLSRV